MRQIVRKQLGKYLYHGTTGENIAQIAYNGLVPRKSWNDNLNFNNPIYGPKYARRLGFFVVERESDALGWAARRADEILTIRGEDEPIFVIRFDSAVLTRPLRRDRHVLNAWVVDETILPQHLEVRAHNQRGWDTIIDYQ